MALPILIGLAFVLLAEIVDWFDNHSTPQSPWAPLRLWLSQYVGDTEAAIGVLSAIAGSLFTVTSVTFSILLLAVQQGATVLNSQIVDHYLRNKANRAWFGFFVGVSLFVLITLVQTTHTKQPVFGVIVSTLLGAVALVALVMLIYSTVDQIRPSTVLTSIVATAIAARENQLEILSRTAEAPHPPAGLPLTSPTSGYFVHFDIDEIARVLQAHPDARLTFVASIGDFLPQGASVALLSGSAPAAPLVEALTFDVQRDLETDPAYSLEHVANIGWTATSSAHSDPAVGNNVLNALQTLLHAWAPSPPRLPPDATQIYYSDNLHERVSHALEDMLVAATESRQHQSMSHTLNIIAAGLALVPEERRASLLGTIPCASKALQDTLPTRPLRAAVHRLQTQLVALNARTEAAQLASALQDEGPNLKD